MKTFSIVSAFTKSSRGIGFKNTLPWNFPEDMKHFNRITTGTVTHPKTNAVVMGRKTFESLPKKFRPLPNRYNVVISSTMNYDLEGHSDYWICNSFDKALTELVQSKNINDIFVIGGETLWKETINHEQCGKIIATEIDDQENPIECDRFFPKIPYHFRLTNKVVGKDQSLSFLTYENCKDTNSDENQYVDLLKDIIENGEEIDGRNGKVISVFGSPQHKFDLRKGFPLLTTKRMPFDIIIKELLFFIRGDTDAKSLDKEGVRIWNGNTTREFLDQRGLSHYKVGDMGPMYGWNWRHFGSSYESCDTNYEGKGFDQLHHLLDNIVNNPSSRRLLLTTYDPSKVQESVLAPCHGLTIQFNVSNDNKYLDCKMYQRSVDTALGYPFNIASYAAFTAIIGHVTNLTPRYLYMTLGDTHLYESHIEKVKRHFDRTPLKFPKMEITKSFENTTSTSTEDRIKFLENLTYKDFELKDYAYYPGIKMDMIA